MRPIVRWLPPLAATAATAAALLLALAGAGCASNAARYAVPRTVVDDPGLPQATIRGVRLHVPTFGDPANPAVIVVHGGPGNDSRYLLPLRDLADTYHVVFYDQRGSGLSERVSDEQLTLEELYAELGAVIERYGKGRPVRLVGHSWGAMLASGYVGQHPEKVSHLVLAEPGMLTPETAQLLMEATNGMRPPLSLGALAAVGKAWLQSLRVDGPDDDARSDWFMSSVMHADIEDHPIAGYFCGRDMSTARLEEWRFGARVAPALFEKAFDEDGKLTIDFVTGVERFPHEVLFMAGSCNAIVGEAQQRLHMRHFPRAELIVIEGSGHTMFGEKPQESIAAVRRYLDEDHSAEALSQRD